MFPPPKLASSRNAPTYPAWRSRVTLATNDSRFGFGAKWFARLGVFGVVVVVGDHGYSIGHVPIRKRRIASEKLNVGSDPSRFVTVRIEVTGGAQFVLGIALV